MVASPHSFGKPGSKITVLGENSCIMFMYIYIISMKPTEWLLSLFLSSFTETLALERTFILFVLGAKKKKKRFRLIIYRNSGEASPFDEAWTSLGSLKTNICSLLLRMRYVFIRGNAVN